MKSLLPRSATLNALLPHGSDRALRELLYNFFAVSHRMEEIRRSLGKRIGLSGPQYSLTMAVAELQGVQGVSVREVAEYLHVASTFVTAQSEELVKKRYLKKAADPGDRRISRLMLDSDGIRALRSLLPDLQRVNDTLFAGIPREDFIALHRSFERLLDGSGRAVLVSQPVVSKVLSESKTFSGKRR